MVRVNSQSLARREVVCCARISRARRSFVPAGWEEQSRRAAGYLGATIREDDRLDNDREVGELPPLGRVRREVGSSRAKTADNEGDRVA